MLWLTLSLLTALTVATQDAWVKKHFSLLGPYAMVAYPALYSLPLFIPALCLTPRPPLDGVYLACLLASLPLNGVAYVLYMQAIRISPLSLTLPYLAFTPAFMIATGALLLGERLNIWGVAGILTTCCGSYILNLNTGRRSPLSPLRSVFREAGSRRMLTVALIFSLAAVVGKKGILHSSPFFFTVSFFTVFNILFLFCLALPGKIRLANYRDQPLQGAIAGGLLFLHALLHGYAISMAQAAYMIAVKRFSILFGVLYGGLFFKERDIAVRFMGAALMLSGAVMIILKG
jgi:drug/metabolite transporter (DMT)-like permease